MEKIGVSVCYGKIIQLHKAFDLHKTYNPFKG